MAKFYRRTIGLFWMPILLCLSGIAGAIEFTTTEKNGVIMTVLSEPVQFCFGQSEWSGDVRMTTLKTHMIVKPEDYLKDGDIFVGFSRFDQDGTPDDVLWLYGRTGPANEFPLSWNKYDLKQAPASYYSGQLYLITVLNIITQPVDLSYVDKRGWVFVGYGLRAKVGATALDAFQEMLEKHRYQPIWVIGGGTPAGDMICLKFTEMNRIGLSSSF
ncbi:MAG: hypothetical protein WAW41_03150 [Methylobacter sp.]